MNKRRNTITPAPEYVPAILNGEPFETGDFFRLTDQPGQRFKYLTINKDGSVLAWGGDKSPLARQSFRSFASDLAFIKVHETKDERRRREAQEAQRAGIRPE